MKKLTQWLVLAIIAVGVFMRLTVHGNLGLSVANADTESYVESSQVNPLSWEAFTNYRPFTTNLIYKVFTPGNGYRYRALSNTETGTVQRIIDRGFKDIAMLQSVVSIIAWACLAWTFSSRLQSGIVKIASAGLIMAFGFTPQIADWDSVLSSESLSISLFILAFAILIWLAFAFYDDPKINAKKIIGSILLFAALFFWVFVRDVNAYSLIFPVILLLGLYVFPRFRKTKFFFFAGIIIFSLFIVGEISARQRPLWQLALGHVWASDILPFPGNVEFFAERGMPEHGTPEYTDWFNEHARSTYAQFLLAHPVYTTFKFFRDLNATFATNMQSYFDAKDLPTRPALIIAGNYLHSKSGSIFFITLALLLIMCSQIFYQNKPNIPWMWLMGWAFLTAGATVFVSIFGDTYGTPRHALSSTMTYRLLTWMLLFILADFSMMRTEKQAPAN